MEGYKFPRKLTSQRLNELDSWELRLYQEIYVAVRQVYNLLSLFCRNIATFFNETAISADSGSRVNQTYCFGMGMLVFEFVFKLLQLY